MKVHEKLPEQTTARQTLKKRTAVFSAFDRHLADFLCDLMGPERRELFALFLLLSYQIRAGHVCLDLNRPLRPTTEDLASFAESELLDDLEKLGPDLQTMLQNTSIVGDGDVETPLVLLNGRLYLYRYYRYERELLDQVLARSRSVVPGLDVQKLRAGLGRLFPAGSVWEDAQKLAAALCALKPFVVLTGGPGTGKTTTVIKILTLLLEQQPGLRIALCAPTGKAALRLQGSLQQAKQVIEAEAETLELIPDEVQTIHRLLGTRSFSPYFRHDVGNPLPLDLLVMDEASMVDLPLLAKLLRSLPAAARVVLIGDPHQLASVAAGSTLADICRTKQDPELYSEAIREQVCSLTGERYAPSLLSASRTPVAAQTSAPSRGRKTRAASQDSQQLLLFGASSAGDESADVESAEDKSLISETNLGDCIVQLRRNYRFGQDSGIGRLSRAVQTGDADGAVGILRDGRLSDLFWSEESVGAVLSPGQGELFVAGYRAFLQARDPLECLGLFDAYRILCAHRHGRQGVLHVNRLVEELLQSEGLPAVAEGWYDHRPVLITRNDYSHNLFNGDTGVILEVGGETRAYFRDFSSHENALRVFLPEHLPEHETCFAMTVHKSQGSEFDRVALVLPAERSLVLVRELVYTGVTRARDCFELIGGEGVFREAVLVRSDRVSGVGDLV